MARDNKKLKQQKYINELKVLSFKKSIHMNADGKFQSYDNLEPLGDDVRYWMKLPEPKRSEK